MRISAIIIEAFLSVRTRAARPLLALLIFVVGTGGLLAFELLAIRHVLKENATFAEAGARITSIEASGGINGAWCDNLQSANGVLGAGAFSNTKGITLTVLPSSEIPTKRVSPGFIKLLTHQQVGSGLVLSTAVAQTIGATVGSAISTSSGPSVVAGIYNYPEDGRYPDLRWAILSANTATGTYDQCWLEAADNQTPSIPFLQTATTPQSSKKAKIGQVNPTLGNSYDGRKIFDERQSKFSPYFALAFGLTVGFTFVLMRRLQLASALHARVTKTALALQVLTENLLWLVPSTVLLAAISLIFALPADNTDLSALLYDGTRVIMSSFAGTLIGSILGIILIKERHLFNYFRQR